MGYHCNGLDSRYQEMGRPADSCRKTVAKLDDLPSGEPVAETTAAVKGDEECSTTQALLGNDV
jgi:hypothetical protein